MDLIDDIHPLFGACGGENGLVPEGTHIVHTVVGSRVQLHHIHDGTVVDAPAGGTGVAGIAIHRMLAVHGLGQNFRAGGLAGAPGADKQIGVAELVVPDLIFQRFGDMLLPHHIVKGAGTVFPI